MYLCLAEWRKVSKLIKYFNGGIKYVYSEWCQYHRWSLSYLWTGNSAEFWTLWKYDFLQILRTFLKIALFNDFSFFAISLNILYKMYWFLLFCKKMTDPKKRSQSPTIWVKIWWITFTWFIYWKSVSWYQFMI